MHVASEITIRSVRHNVISSARACFFIVFKHLLCFSISPPMDTIGHDAIELKVKYNFHGTVHDQVSVIISSFFQTKIMLSYTSHNSNNLRNLSAFNEVKESFKVNNPLDLKWERVPACDIEGEKGKEFVVNVPPDWRHELQGNTLFIFSPFQLVNEYVCCVIIIYIHRFRYCCHVAFSPIPIFFVFVFCFFVGMHDSNKKGSPSKKKKKTTRLYFTLFFGIVLFCIWFF